MYIDLLAGYSELAHLFLKLLKEPSDSTVLKITIAWRASQWAQELSVKPLLASSQDNLQPLRHKIQKHAINVCFQENSRKEFGEA